MRNHLYAFSHASRVTHHMPHAIQKIYRGLIRLYPLLALILASCSSCIPARVSLLPVSLSRSPCLHTCRFCSSGPGGLLSFHIFTHTFLPRFRNVYHYEVSLICFPATHHTTSSFLKFAIRSLFFFLLLSKKLISFLFLFSSFSPPRSI